MFSLYICDQAPDPFNDKSNGLASNASNEFQTDKFATTFDDHTPVGGFGGGFNDSFAGGFSTGAAEPFGLKQDPFGDKRSANPAITPDVSGTSSPMHNDGESLAYS